MLNRIGLFVLAWLLPGLAQAAVLETVKVAEGVYVLVGSTQNRTYDNHALNNTLGFVVTADGVALIDSGASNSGAALIEAAVREVSDRPIRWVINLGAQDHRWLGNAYFAQKGARIIALQRTATMQQSFADEHLALLRPILKDRLDGTVALTAPEPVTGDQADLPSAACSSPCAGWATRITGVMRYFICLRPACCSPVIWCSTTVCSVSGRIARWMPGATLSARWKNCNQKSWCRVTVAPAIWPRHGGIPAIIWIFWPTTSFLLPAIGSRLMP